MVSFLLRLPLNLILAAYALFWLLLSLVGNFAFFWLLAAGYLVWVYAGRTPYEQLHRADIAIYTVTVALFVCGALRKLSRHLPPPRQIVWFRSRPRRLPPMPVPVVAVIAQPADAPTATKAMARLDPALRQLILTPPPAELAA